MVPTSFDESNDVIGPPNGMENCEALSIARCVMPDGAEAVVSCWKLTAEELTEINRTGRVWLMSLGRRMPPVALHVEKPFISP